MNDNVRYFGNVRVGNDVSVEELRNIYPVLVLATGSSGNRQVDIPGSNLRGIHYARDFVSWYNCLPGAKDTFNLTGQTAVIIG
jgi:NADPH-dependent glutamate synthase beta subunit-like oxidoreductase